MNTNQKELLIKNMTENLPTLRKRLGISQEELSEKVGVSRSTIAGIENKKKEESLKKINSYTDEEDGIKVTWDVGIGSLYNNNPFAYNIQIFCTKHGNVPLRMIGGHCTDPTCPNAIKYFNKNIIKNNIESVLIDAQNKNS